MLDDLAVVQPPDQCSASMPSTASRQAGRSAYLSPGSATTAATDGLTSPGRAMAAWPALTGMAASSSMCTSLVALAARLGHTRRAAAPASNVLSVSTSDLPEIGASFAERDRGRLGVH
ncbi:MAG: hypothetical protein F4017_07835 [Acidimicrobiaceae bacterium]|nr:hypothetical protein [Acidimicrobiaceae bacterium]MYE74970.1 hypothetical protein [Acidimicrobiaceae bacterium]MYH42223.1 hypothetical protein [Acidimicrobiaceae bacterium]MYJ42623.1 hypothetical protein [Acidimicrobiaceae bacterium]MYJ80566.1 hypothetical protein [Acidimicrobiaceae bacterium]